MKRGFSGQRPDSPVEVLLRARPNHGNTAAVQQVLLGGGVGVLGFLLLQHLPHGMWDLSSPTRD